MTVPAIPSNVQPFFVGLNTVYDAAYASPAVPVWHTKVFGVHPMSSEREGFGWLGTLDRARLWNGNRKIHQLTPQTYYLTEQPFELSFSIDKFRVSNDQFGLYAPGVQRMATAMAKLWDYEGRDLLCSLGNWSGTAAQAGLDGLSHWNTAHPVNIYNAAMGTYCNDFGTAGVSINGVTVGGYFNQNSYATLRAEFMSRKSENGEAFGLDPNLLMVGPQLDYVARTVLNATFIAPQTVNAATQSITMVGPNDNVGLRGTADVLVNKDLVAAGTPNVWYLLATNHGVMPFTIGLRQAPVFQYLISESDMPVFNAHQYVYGAHARGVPGWSHAWLSARSGV